jgi:hypothetical protein
VLRANFVLPLIHLGLADQAREQSRLARTRAVQVAQPMARMLSLWTAGLVHIRCEAPKVVAALAEELNAVVEAGMLKQGEGPVRWLRGWAKAQLGSPREGFKLIREGYEDHLRLGMSAGMSETLGMAADALLLDGDWQAAQTQVDEGFALANRIDERVGLPNLNLLQGRIALARGDHGTAITSMRQALAIARSQTATFYELKSLVAICGLQEATSTDHAELKQTYANLQEGLDLPTAKRAAEMVAGF